MAASGSPRRVNKTLDSGSKTMSKKSRSRRKSSTEQVGKITPTSTEVEQKALSAAVLLARAYKESGINEFLKHIAVLEHGKHTQKEAINEAVVQAWYSVHSTFPNNLSESRKRNIAHKCVRCFYRLALFWTIPDRPSGLGKKSHRREYRDELTTAIDAAQDKVDSALRISKRYKSVEWMPKLFFDQVESAHESISRAQTLLKLAVALSNFLASSERDAISELEETIPKRLLTASMETLLSTLQNSGAKLNPSAIKWKDRARVRKNRKRPKS